MSTTNKDFGGWKVDLIVAGEKFTGKQLAKLLPSDRLPSEAEKTAKEPALRSIDYDIKKWCNEEKEQLYTFNLDDHNPNEKLAQWRRMALFLTDSLKIKSLSPQKMDILWVEIAKRICSVQRAGDYIHYIADHGPIFDLQMWQAFCIHFCANASTPKTWSYDAMIVEGSNAAVRSKKYTFATICEWRTQKLSLNLLQKESELQRMKTFVEKFLALGADVPSGGRKISVLSWRLQSNHRQADLLFRPITSVFKLQGPPYHAFAEAVAEIEGYQTIDFSEEFRKTFKGEVSQYDFIPLLTGTWFLSEAARSKTAFIMGLMVLDLMHYERDLFHLHRCLVHPCGMFTNFPKGEFLEVPINAPPKNFSKKQVQFCGGRHPMCGKDSAPLYHNKNINVSWKEEDVLVRWVELCTTFFQLGDTRAAITSSIEKLLRWRLLNCELIETADWEHVLRV